MTSLDFTDDHFDQSTLLQVMAWCRQATSHYLSQCWPRSLSQYGVTRPQWVNSLRLGQNGHHFADNIFNHNFLNENIGISLEISLKFVPKVWINNIPALVQIMAWRQPGDKPLSEPMMVNLLTHICAARPQWVNMLNRLKDALTFRIISWRLFDRRRPNSQWSKSTCCLSNTVNTMTADALSTEGARASVGIVLTK